MKIYPLQLQGVTKSPIWGGTRLLKNWNKKANTPTIGESWELTVRSGDMSTVCNGHFAGKTLGALLTAYPREILGATDMGEGVFPLLVKLIDATDRLSVQVHPDDRYAAEVEHDRGKTEMWYIVEAEPDAEIICGLLDGVTREDYAAAVAKGDFESLLKHQRVQAGETYFIPAGLPHAIGKGILVAEIQQNCDLTYRVYDYDRRQKDGTLRELHIEKALDVIRPFTVEEIEGIRYQNCSRKPREGLLADCIYFRVQKLESAHITALSPSPYLRHVLCLSGFGEIRCGMEVYPIKKGDSFLLPASLPTVTLHDVTCLMSTAY